jgi:hypothetical protein
LEFSINVPNYFHKSLELAVVLIGTTINGKALKQV